MRNYTRWKMSAARRLYADILGAPYTLIVDPNLGTVQLLVPDGDVAFAPDEARMLGVRLIEGAALADGDRAIREVGE